MPAQERGELVLDQLADEVDPAGCRPAGGLLLETRTQRAVADDGQAQLRMARCEPGDGIDGQVDPLLLVGEPGQQTTEPGSAVSGPGLKMRSR